MTQLKAGAQSAFPPNNIAQALNKRDRVTLSAVG
jgi:hypothetical protein